MGKWSKNNEIGRRNLTKRNKKVVEGKTYSKKFEYFSGCSESCIHNEQQSHCCPSCRRMLHCYYHPYSTKARKFSFNFMIKFPLFPMIIFPNIAIGNDKIYWFIDISPHIKPQQVVEFITNLQEFVSYFLVNSKKHIRNLRKAPQLFDSNPLLSPGVFVKKNRTGGPCRFLFLFQLINIAKNESCVLIADP